MRRCRHDLLPCGALRAYLDARVHAAYGLASCGHGPHLASPRITDDFAALCACGGRFSGTESEARARELLASRMADATGRTVQRGRVRYRCWARGPARLILPDGRSLEAQGLVRTPATPPLGLTARLVDLGRGTPGDVGSIKETVRGAIVLVRHEFMMSGGHVHRRKKYDAARAAGAAGFVIACHEPGRPGGDRFVRRRRLGSRSGRWHQLRSGCGARRLCRATGNNRTLQVALPIP